MKRSEALGIRKTLDSLVVKIVDTPSEINDNMAAIRLWTPGAFAVDDVRMYNGSPRRCIQAHDSAENPAWTPDEAALWMEYHGTTAETARPWVAPTGAHDIYKKGEFMIWTDGRVAECLENTNFSPEEYPQAWKFTGEEA